MIWIYRLLLGIAIPFVLISLYFRGFKNPKYRLRWRERFGSVPLKVSRLAPFDLWIHAVSVGETRAVSPLIKHYLKQDPSLKIVLTTTTPTGADMAALVLPKEVTHVYLPYDLKWAMRRFIRNIHPRFALILETEIWPNMIQLATEYDIPISYLNVRLSAGSYKSYSRLKSFFSKLLNKVDYFSVQGQQDHDHLSRLGVSPEKLFLTGSIKFDFEIPMDIPQQAKAQRAQFGNNRLIWIAGSTRDEEELILLGVHKQLKEKYPNCLLLMVPRHPERFNLVAQQIEDSGMSLVRRSSSEKTAFENVDVYLGDTMGDLSLLYASSDVAFVGGSLKPLGGQNILEPAALGLPVLFGPHVFNFPDISRWAIEVKSAVMVDNAQELYEQIDLLFTNDCLRQERGKAGKDLIQKHKGALQKNIDMLSRFLPF